MSVCRGFHAKMCLDRVVAVVGTCVDRAPRKENVRTVIAGADETVKNMPKINSFDVFKRMGDTNNRAMQLAPLGNIIKATKVKAGTEITIGVGGNLITGIMNGDYIGGLIMCDKAEFDKVKAGMEEEQNTPYWPTPKWICSCGRKSAELPDGPCPACGSGEALERI